MYKEQFISSIKISNPETHEEIAFNKDVDKYLSRIPEERLKTYDNIINNSLLPLFDDIDDVFKKCFTLGRIIEREKIAVSEDYVFRYFTMEELIYCLCIFRSVTYVEISSEEYGDRYDLKIPFFDLTPTSESTKIAKKLVREIINTVVPLKVAVPVKKTEETEEIEEIEKSKESKSLSSSE